MGINFVTNDQILFRIGNNRPFYSEEVKRNNTLFFFFYLRMKKIYIYVLCEHFLLL